MLRSVSTEVYTLLSFCTQFSRTFFPTGQPLPFDQNSANSTTIIKTQPTQEEKQQQQEIQPETSKTILPTPNSKSENNSLSSPDINSNDILPKLINFRTLLDSKITELGKMIESAQGFLTLPEISEAATGHINNAVGSANLLITGKFKQFGGLCDLHYGVKTEEGGSNPPNYDDLQGFWEMIFITFEGVKAEFDDIEKWRQNGWNEPEQKPVTPTVKRNVASRPNSRPASANSTSSKKAVRGRNSSSALREQIRQARLAKKREAESKNNSMISETNSLPDTPKRTVVEANNNNNSSSKDLSAGDAEVIKSESKSVPEL